MFTTNPTNQNIPALHTSIGDTITATYSGTTKTATIKNSTYGTFPTQGPQPYLTALNCNNDNDHDTICEEWETSSGLNIPYNGTTYSLPCNPNATYDPTAVSPQFYNPLGDKVCPDKNGNKDIYVEIDYLTRHAPDVQALTDVVNAFQNHGINLHLFVDDDIGYHNDQLSGPVSFNSDFNNIKKAMFGTLSERTSCPGFTSGSTACNNYISNILTAKRQVFHYALYMHSNLGYPGSSGLSELPGNDISISLGNFTGSIGSKDQQEGTFMHELGHNLGLDHGGNSSINCKPNYLSVMSYSRQFTNLISNRPLDYSESVLPTLNENSLNESAGVGASTPPGLVTAYGPPPFQTRATGLKK